MATSAWSGTLTLRNGDRLSGEFVRVDEQHLYWQSPMFGTLQVAKAEVDNIDTSKPLKIHGVRTPCLIEGMDDELLVYICGGDPEERRVPLVSLAVITPYKNFIAGTYNYSGRISLSGTYARGNDVRDDWKLSAGAEYRRHDWRHNTNLEYASYSSQKLSPNIKWGGRYALDWFFRERWFFYNEIRYGSDELRALERYYNVGSGTGFQVWENPDTALALTGGLVYVHEVFPRPEEPAQDFQRSEERAAWRLGGDFRYRLPLNVALFHRNEMLRPFGDSDDWSLSTSTGMNTMIADRLYSEIKVEYNVDNEPPLGTEREDLRLHLGLGYEW